MQTKEMNETTKLPFHKSLFLKACEEPTVKIIRRA